MKGLAASTVAAISLLVLAGANSAPAAFPGKNGLIVFASSAGENVTPQLFSIGPGGTGRRNLTQNRDSNYGGVWSPDGLRIAFSQLHVPGSVLVVMNADGSEQRRLTDAEQWASDPSWSPDGSLIAYWQSYAPYGIHVIHPDGTGDQLVGPGLAGSGVKPAWSPDGLRLVVAREIGGGNKALTELDLGGGAPHDLVRGGYYTNAAWSPDGTSIAYAVYAGDAGYEIHTVRPDGTGNRLVIRGWRAVWSPDSRRLAVVGDVNSSTVTVVAADGSGSVALSQHASDYPTWSPDGRRLAFVEDLSDVYLANADGGDRRQVTHEPIGSRVEHPEWSPDGDRILYQSMYEANDLDLYAVPSGGGPIRPITQNSLEDFDPAWSPDGTAIAFVRGNPGSDTGGIFVADASGGAVRSLTSKNGFDSSPSWSPDGSRIVFARAAQEEESSLYVMRSDGSNLRWLGAGADPAWSPDGRTIAFAAGDALWLMRSDGSRRKLLIDPRDTATTLGVEDPDLVDSLFAPAWSPDGKSLAFAAYYYPYGPRGDYFAALTVRSDGAGVALRLPDAEGNPTPEWSPDGKSLLFGAGDLLVEPVTGGTPVARTQLSGWSGDGTWQPRCTVYGSARADILHASAGKNILCGLGGDDTITGGPDRDRLFGENGNDRILARDGEFDVIGCGPGTDTVSADAVDLVGRDCERVER